MPKEYEAKFLNIDVDTIKKILRKNGAKKSCQKMVPKNGAMMHPGQNNKWHS